MQRCVQHALVNESTLQLVPSRSDHDHSIVPNDRRNTITISLFNSFGGLDNNVDGRACTWKPADPVYAVLRVSMHRRIQKGLRALYGTDASLALRPGQPEYLYTAKHLGPVQLQYPSNQPLLPLSPTMTDTAALPPPLTPNPSRDSKSRKSTKDTTYDIIPT